MGASNCRRLKFAKPAPRAQTRTDLRRAAEKLERAIYALVSLRDHYRCRCCGRGGDPRAVTLLGKLHHDHLVPRSRGGQTVPENVILLCSQCHSLKTAHELEPHGNPERGTLTFTITSAAAATVFGKKRPSNHVRIG